MITEYRNKAAPKAPGPWYTYTYDNGIRATLSEYQGNILELEELGRGLSRRKRREIRMRVHNGRTDRIHAIFHFQEDEDMKKGFLKTIYETRRDKMRDIEECEGGICCRNMAYVEDIPAYAGMNGRYENGSDPDDIVVLRNWLSSRYTASTLVQDALAEYDGVTEGNGADAVYDFIRCIAQDMGLHISVQDLVKISKAVVERGDITY